MAKLTKQSVKKTGKGRKEQIVAQLIQKMDASNGLVFTDYKGITHIQLENLKKDLKTMDSTIVIAKNSLINISLGQSKKYADFKDNEALEAPTATLFISGDMVEPLKKLQKAIKEIGLPKVKFAILEGALIDEAGVMKIAALPSRDTLIAQFVGTLNSPIQGLVVTLNGTIQKFVMTLDAIAKTKPASSSAAPTEGTETAAEATPTAEPAPAVEVSSTETSATETTETETPTSDQPSETATESADATSEAPTTTEETPAEESNETATEDKKENNDTKENQNS